MWLETIEKVFIVNLQKRTDRLLETAQLLDDYEIPYDVFPAVEKENGAEGLRDTMVLIFNQAIANNYKQILVFEDDIDIVVAPKEFHYFMDNVVEQLPSNYVMCFLGCQITGKIDHFPSPNLIAAQKMFSTHAVLYSLQGMRNILALGLDYPIDNFYVSDVESMKGSFCTNPFLVSQREGYSDIGKNYISWKPFLEHRFETRIAEHNGRR